MSSRRRGHERSRSLGDPSEIARIAMLEIVENRRRFHRCSRSPFHSSFNLLVHLVDIISDESISISYLSSLFRISTLPDREEFRSQLERICPIRHRRFSRKWPPIIFPFGVGDTLAFDRASEKPIVFHGRAET